MSLLFDDIGEPLVKLRSRLRLAVSEAAKRLPVDSSSMELAELRGIFDLVRELEDRVFYFDEEYQQ